MGKKHKHERARSRSHSPKRKKAQPQRDHSSSPPPPKDSPTQPHKSRSKDGHSKKKHKRKSRSPSLDHEARRRSVSPPPPQQHQQQQQPQHSRENRPRSSSLSPESRRKQERRQRKEERQPGRAEGHGGRWDDENDSWGGERRGGGGRDGGREERGGGGRGGGGEGERREGRREAPSGLLESENSQDSKEVEKEKANLGLSGKLAEDTNTFRGVVIKYNEPPEARKPKVKWRLYQFKGEEALPTLFVHRQSAYLVGRDRLIADIPVDHPSCSKQHAVLQYRLSEYTRPDGSRGKRVIPYIIDLGATNKTYLNNKPIDAQRYHELREKDVLKFGFSTREYVLLNDKSADTEEDDEGEA